MQIGRRLFFTLFGLVLVLAVLAGGAAGQATGAPWEAWLFDPDPGYMVKVASDGTVLSEFALPRTTRDTLSNGVAVSRDGRYIAYVIYHDPRPSGSPDPYRVDLSLQVYDTTVNSVVASYTRPTNPGDYVSDSLSLGSSPMVFHESNSAVAVGFGVNDIWELVVLDIPSNSVATRLTSADLATHGLSVSGGAMNPVAQSFSGNTIDFLTINVGTEGLDIYPSFTWNIAMGPVAAGTIYHTLANDTWAATGEVVETYQDFNWPNAGGAFPFFQKNVLSYYTLGGSPTVIYNTPSHSMSAPIFIQNGERIGVQYSNEDGTDIGWHLIEKSGTWFSSRSASQRTTSWMGTPDGFAYTFSGPGGDTFLWHLNTRLDSMPDDAVWDSTAHPGDYYRLVWVGTTGLTIPPVAITPIAPIPVVTVPPIVVEPIVTVPPIVVQPIATVPPIVVQPIATVPLVNVPPINLPNQSQQGALAVGGQAQIYTTEGDILNMRSGPGTNYDIVERLQAGTLVTLLEGPMQSGNYTWWRVRTTSGQEGWVIEGLPEDNGWLQTLIPLP